MMADFLDRLVARARQTPRAPSPLVSDIPQSLEVATTTPAPSPTSSPVTALERATTTTPQPAATKPRPAPIVERTVSPIPVTNHVTVIEQKAPPPQPSQPVPEERLAPAPPTATPVEIIQTQPTHTVEHTEHTERHVVEQVVATPSQSTPEPARIEAMQPPSPAVGVTAHPLPVLPAAPLAPAPLAPIVVPSAPAPEVHVHIGRVDIRGPEPQPRPQPQAPTTHPEPPKVLSLGDYLHGRRADGGR